MQVIPYGPVSAADPMHTPDSPPPHGGTRCAAYSRRTGTRCRNLAMRGQTTCRMHGGAKPVARRNGEARLRRAEALDPAQAMATEVADDRHPAELLLHELAVAANAERVLADEVAGLATLTE